MSKDIFEYLHYYIGQTAMHPGLKNPQAITGRWAQSMREKRIQVKPILRKLESMEDKEAIELAKFVTDPRYHKHIQIFQIKPNKIDFMDGTMWQGDGVEEYNDCEILFNYLSAAQFHYLLSRGFWLFGDDWFDEGLIIDKNTLS